MSNKWQRILAVVLALFVLVGGSWIADGIKGEILFSDWSDFFGDRAWGLLIALGVFLASSYGLYRLRHAFTKIQSLSQHKCAPHKSLILLVSKPDSRIELDADSRMLHFFSDGDGTEIQLSDDLCGDIKKLDKLSQEKPSCKWNWQQQMRAIKPHIVDSRKRLRRLHLIGSTGDGGSLKRLDSSKEWLKEYLPGVKITKDESGVDFNDFNAVVQHIQEIINEQKKEGKGKEKLTDKDIVIDVTGGTSMASIAAASTTLNTRVTFQYVQTTSREVYAYDVAYLSHDE